MDIGEIKRGCKMKTLIIFYSYEGNTKFIAETMATQLDADVLELKLEKEYKTKGFMRFIWIGKEIMLSRKPKLKEFDKNIESYDLILIGTPVWAFTFTPPLRRFFAENKIQGKKIALFCTHEGKKGKTIENMEKKLQGNKIIAKTDFGKVKENKEENRKKAIGWCKSFS